MQAHHRLCNFFCPAFQMAAKKYKDIQGNTASWTSPVTVCAACAEHSTAFFSRYSQQAFLSFTSDHLAVLRCAASQSCAHCTYIYASSPAMCRCGCSPKWPCKPHIYLLLALTQCTRCDTASSRSLDSNERQQHSFCAHLLSVLTFAGRAVFDPDWVPDKDWPPDSSGRPLIYTAAGLARSILEHGHVLSNNGQRVASTPNSAQWTAISAAASKALVAFHWFRHHPDRSRKTGLCSAISSVAVVKLACHQVCSCVTAVLSRFAAGALLLQVRSFTWIQCVCHTASCSAIGITTLSLCCMCLVHDQ